MVSASWQIRKSHSFSLGDSAAPVRNETQAYNLTSREVNLWLQNEATASYRNYINNVTCTMDSSSAAYRFCLHDTVLTQSALLGQLTVTSVNAYRIADKALGKDVDLCRLLFSGGSTSFQNEILRV